jgi:thioredoxin-dependent peroxiredoxin
MRVKTGQNAPDFRVTDIKTQQILRLENFSGRKLLVSFHRYAACPMCNLHIHELSQSYEALSKLGLEILAIFRSSAERTLEQYGGREVPFPIAVDLDLNAYRAYGIEYSTAGMLLSFVHPRGLIATLKGFLPGKIDGDVRTLPADFLITPDQTVQQAYYSSNITQHLPLSEIRRFASGAV